MGVGDDRTVGRLPWVYVEAARRTINAAFVKCEYGWMHEYLVYNKNRSAGLAGKGIKKAGNTGL